MHSPLPSVSTADLATLRALIEPFVDGEAVSEHCRIVAGHDVPAPFGGLLVHNDHMTTTLGEFHGGRVRLDVLNSCRSDSEYRRMILLRAGESDRVVEIGFVRMDLHLMSGEVSERILDRGTPLGDILIEHNVMRRIEPRWFFRVEAGSPLLARFERPVPEHAYGRVGIIYCDERPAIELVEVVTNRRAGTSNGPGVVGDHEQG